MDQFNAKCRLQLQALSRYLLRPLKRVRALGRGRSVLPAVAALLPVSAWSQSVRGLSSGTMLHWAEYYLVLLSE